MKKTYSILLVIVGLLIIIRLMLPYFVVKYVNKVLNDIEGYQGSIIDVDLHLYRGAYVIDSMVIEKIEGNQPVPFFASKRIDLSVHWNAIFDGRIVGEVILEQPKINFVAGGDSTEAQYGEDVDWTKPLKELIPLQINLFSVNNGELHFQDFSAEPPVDVYLNDLQLKTTNLSNAQNVNDTLPSNLKLTAKSLGNGDLLLTGNMNVLKEIPDFDLDLTFENVDITALNDFLEAYAKVDAEQGVFHLYAEMLLLDGQLEGYVKPLLVDLKVIDLSDDDKSALLKIWEVVVGTVLEVFENQPADQFATKMPISGDLKNTDAGILPALWNILSNAFVEAFKKNTDNTIEFVGKSEKINNH